MIQTIARFSRTIHRRNSSSRAEGAGTRRRTHEAASPPARSHTMHSLRSLHLRRVPQRFACHFHTFFSSNSERRERVQRLTKVPRQLLRLEIATHHARELHLCPSLYTPIHCISPLTLFSTVCSRLFSHLPLMRLSPPTGTVGCRRSSAVQSSRCTRTSAVTPTSPALAREQGHCAQVARPLCAVWRREIEATDEATDVNTSSTRTLTNSLRRDKSDAN